MPIRCRLSRRLPWLVHARAGSQSEEELVERELADVAGPWTGPDGLLLQQQVLAQAWSDPALDAYNRD